jgi:hypothetical protein
VQLSLALPKPFRCSAPNGESDVASAPAGSTSDVRFDLSEFFPPLLLFFSASPSACKLGLFVILPAVSLTLPFTS